MAPAAAKGSVAAKKGAPNTGNTTSCLSSAFDIALFSSSGAGIRSVSSYNIKSLCCIFEIFGIYIHALVYL